MIPSYKRAFIVILLMGPMTFPAISQVKFGLKWGLTVSEMLAGSQQTATVSSIPMSIINYPRTNINAGIFFDVPLAGKLHLQPELVYNNQGSVTKPAYNYTISATEVYKFNYLNLPLLFKWQLPRYFYAATGPQFGLLLDAKIDESLIGKNTTYHTKQQYKPLDFAWTLAAGYLSPVNLGIDVRYNLGFSDINNSSASAAASIPIQNGRFRNSGLQIDIFFLFGKNRMPASTPNPGY